MLKNMLLYVIISSGYVPESLENILLNSEYVRKLLRRTFIEYKVSAPSFVTLLNNFSFKGTPLDSGAQIAYAVSFCELEKSICY